jgi:hypothetical protein
MYKGGESFTSTVAVVTTTTYSPDIIGTTVTNGLYAMTLGRVVYETSTGKLWFDDLNLRTSTRENRWAKINGWLKLASTPSIVSKSQLKDKFVDPREGSIIIDGAALTYHYPLGAQIEASEQITITNGTTDPTGSTVGYDMPTSGYLNTNYLYYVNTLSKIFFYRSKTSYQKRIEIFEVSGTDLALVRALIPDQNYIATKYSWSYGLRQMLTAGSTLGPTPAIISASIGGAPTINLLCPNNSYVKEPYDYNANNLTISTPGKIVNTYSVNNYSGSTIVNTDDYTIKQSLLKIKMLKKTNYKSILYILPKRSITSLGYIEIKTSGSSGIVYAVEFKYVDDAVIDNIVEAGVTGLPVTGVKRWIYYISNVRGLQNRRVRLAYIQSNSLTFSTIYTIDIPNLIKDQLNSIHTSNASLLYEIDDHNGSDPIFLVRFPSMNNAPNSVYPYEVKTDYESFKFAIFDPIQAYTNTRFIIGTSSQYAYSCLTNTIFLYRASSTAYVASVVDAYALYRHSTPTIYAKTTSHDIEDVGDTITLGVSGSTSVDVVCLHETDLHCSYNNTWQSVTLVNNSTIALDTQDILNVIPAGGTVLSRTDKSFIIDYDNPENLAKIRENIPSTLTLNTVNSTNAIPTDSNLWTDTLIGKFIARTGVETLYSISSVAPYTQIYGPYLDHKWLPINLGCAKAVSVDTTISYIDSNTGKYWDYQSLQAPITAKWNEYGSSISPPPRITSFQLSAYEIVNNKAVVTIDPADCTLSNMTYSGSTLSLSGTNATHACVSAAVPILPGSAYFATVDFSIADNDVLKPLGINLTIDCYKNAVKTSSITPLYTANVRSVQSAEVKLPVNADSFKVNLTVTEPSNITTTAEIIDFPNHTWLGFRIWNGGSLEYDYDKFMVNSGNTPMIHSGYKYNVGDIAIWRISNTLDTTKVFDYNNPALQSVIRYAVYMPSGFTTAYTLIDGKIVNSPYNLDINNKDTKYYIEVYLDYFRRVSIGDVYVRIGFKGDISPEYLENSRLAKDLYIRENIAFSNCVLHDDVWNRLTYDAIGSNIPRNTDKIYKSNYLGGTVYTYFTISQAELNAVPTYNYWDRYMDNLYTYKISSRAKITDIMVSLIKDRFVQRGTLKIPPAASASDYTLTYQYPFETVPTLEFANNNAYDATVTTTGATIRLSAHTETMFLDWIAWTE